MVLNVNHPVEKLWKCGSGGVDAGSWRVEVDVGCVRVGCGGVGCVGVARGGKRGVRRARDVEVSVGHGVRSWPCGGGSESAARAGMAVGAPQAVAQRGQRIGEGSESQEVRANLSRGEPAQRIRWRVRNSVWSATARSKSRPV